MAFNYGHNQRFPGQGTRMRGMSQQGFGARSFQPNPAFGAQPFNMQQQQGFQGGFGSYQANQPLGPYPGQVNTGQPGVPYQGVSHPSAGQGVAPFPVNSSARQAVPNMHMQQQQFMMQQQKVMEQQKKQEEENKRKQDEMKKRRNFEMQQRKLQSQKKGVRSHLEVDNLFGKKDKGATTAAMNLIGSLGAEASTKAAKQSSSSSVFSRPGSSYQSDGSNTRSTLYGIEFMGQGSPGQTIPIPAAGGADDFGDFAQGPSIPGQGGMEEFSDFQEAKPFGQGSQGPSPGMAPPAVGAGQGPSLHPSWAMPVSTGPSFPQSSGAMTTQSSSPSLQNPVQSTSAPFSMGTFPKTVLTDSFGGLSSASHPALEMATSLGVLKSRSSSVSSQDSLGRGSVSGQALAGVPMHPGGFATTMPDAGDTTPTLSNDEGPEAEPAPEQTAAEQLQALYGTQLPDWCVTGADLPGVYHEVASRTTGGLDAIDTGELYHVLLSSGVSRDKLGLMWGQVNRASPGQLNPLELRLILGLVALAQAGIKAERLTLQKLASCVTPPIPSFPEGVLEARGRGWSFMEQQQTGENTRAPSEATAGSTDKHSAWSESGPAGPAGFMTSGSAMLAPADPNDKYSVFRAVEPADDVRSQEDWGEMTQFQGAGGGMGSSVVEGGKTEVGSVGGIVQQQQQQQQQQNLGFQPGRFLQARPPDDEEFGDFDSVSFDSQSPTNNAASGGDDFGNFQQNVAASHPKSSASVQQLGVKTGADFGRSLQDLAAKLSAPSPNGKSKSSSSPDLFLLEGTDPTPSVTSAISHSSSGDMVVGNDDFGIFQQSAPSVGLTSTTDLPVKTAACTNQSSISSEVFSLHPPALDTNHGKPSIDFVASNRVGGDDDFGDFQQISAPSSVPERREVRKSADLAKALQDFTLKATAVSSAQLPSSLFGDETPPIQAISTQPSQVGSAVEKETKGNATKRQAGAVLSSGTTEMADQKSTSGAGDRYSIFRTPDVSMETSVFGSNSVEKPEKPEKPAADDDFGDFAGSEAVGEVPPPIDDDFGDFQVSGTSTEKAVVPASGQRTMADSNSGNSDNQSSTWVASEAFERRQPHESGSTFVADFGEIQSLSNSDSSKAGCGFSQGSAFESQGFGSQELPKGDSNGDFAAFGDFSGAVQIETSTGSVSGASQALISGVPLELSQRYNLSKQFEDFDQHASAWCRCLNSCLLTLATATLAIHKINAASLRNEILQSKEGSLYFSSISEVYRVTRRIRASVEKTASNNTKLEDILSEVESTWKGIASFLTGSDSLPSQSSLDLSRLHVTSEDDRSVACGVCLLNVEKTAPGASKQADAKLKYGGRQYHTTCANFWCNRVDSVLPTLLPVHGLI